MKIMITITLGLFIVSCQTEKKQEPTLPAPQVQSRSGSSYPPTNIFPDATTSSCPDSAISYDTFNKYSSTNFILDRQILSAFQIDNDDILNIFETSLDIQEQKAMFEVYELFERQKDSLKVLVFKEKAKLVKGESPETLEYYLFQNDTLLGDSQHPVYYYYEKDSLRIIEEPHYDNVEGCSFGKTERFFKAGKNVLSRRYDYDENCGFGEDLDSAASMFRESYNFVRSDESYTFDRLLIF